MAFATLMTAVGLGVTALAQPDRASDRSGGRDGTTRVGSTSAAVLGTALLVEPLQAPTPPRFVYATGPQGVGYYASARTQAPTRPATRPSTVGPGARNWTTGNRLPLHRPWLRSRR